MAKKIDPAQAKAAKQKKIAIAGGVLLLALLAFQVPRTMKMLHGQGNVTTSASTAPASTTATGSTPLAPPSLDGGATSSGASPGPSAATSDDGVVDPATPLPPSSGQLMSFNRFKSKDPFHQQVADCSADNPCNAGTTTGAAAAGTGKGAGSNTSGGGTGTSAGTGQQPAPAKTAAPSAPAKAAVKLTTATISVNDKVEKVSVGATFPTEDPVFVLVGVTPKEAMIGIAGGSLATGADALGLKVGKTLKLQNTADRTTYVLKLLAVS
jgi:hypothetical protein